MRSKHDATTKAGWCQRCALAAMICRSRFTDAPDTFIFGRRRCSRRSDFVGSIDFFMTSSYHRWLFIVPVSEWLSVHQPTPPHTEVMVMRKRLFIVLLVVCSYFVGGFVQGTTKIVYPGKTVRLVSVGIDPFDQEQLIFTIMTPDDKLIGHFRFPRRHCEVMPRMKPYTFRFVPAPKTKDNSFGGRVEYFGGLGHELTPVPFYPAPRLYPPRAPVVPPSAFDRT